jgi:hypothetical protein
MKIRYLLFIVSLAFLTGCTGLEEEMNGYNNNFSSRLSQNWRQANMGQVMGQGLQIMNNSYQQYQINQIQQSQWQNNFNQDYYKNVQEPANNWYKNAYGK